MMEELKEDSKFAAQDEDFKINNYGDSND